MMIKSADALLKRLQGGETVSLQDRFDGPGKRLAMTTDNQACSIVALRKLLKKGHAAPVSYDIGGEAYEWGLA